MKQSPEKVLCPGADQSENAVRQACAWNSRKRFSLRISGLSGVENSSKGERFFTFPTRAD